jgi:hypothetical protein
MLLWAEPQLPLVLQFGLARVQDAVDPPLAPIHDQVLFVPQVVDPLSLASVPALQVVAVDPQIPDTDGQALLVALQEAVDPPLYPAQDQVADHPQVQAL